MPDIALIHFAPLEQYPPVQNLLNTLSHEKPGISVTVYTTTDVSANIEQYAVHENPNIKIARFGKSGKGTGLIGRYLTYLRFNIGVLIHLLARRPARVLYFETISSWPACIYKKFINVSSKLFIHYHEYSTRDELNNGMFLVSFFHKLEKKVYASAEWISHTNQDRMQFFKSDISPLKISNDHIVPNYPPKHWHRVPKNQFFDPIKVVYVGAVSTKTMYVKEFAEWVKNQKGKLHWHIFTTNITAEAKEFLKGYSEFITFQGGLPYSKLPEVVSGYDVGVVLYKGHIPNYVYNAPNKLFEYLACGLDVWFPKAMTGSLLYEDAQHFPKVIALDFLKLSDVSLDSLSQRPLQQRSEQYYCENALSELIEGLTKRDVEQK